MFARKNRKVLLSKFELNVQKIYKLENGMGGLYYLLCSAPLLFIFIFSVYFFSAKTKICRVKIEYDMF